MNLGRKKFILVVISLVLVIGVFSTDIAVGNITKVQAVASSSTSSKVVTITLSEQDDFKTVDPTWDWIIKAFMAKNPKIKVRRIHNETEGQRTDWMDSVASGAGPEIISCPNDNIGLFAVSKTAMPLDGFLSKDFLATLSAKQVNGCRMDGKLYAIPYKTGNCLALIYNRKFVKKAPQTMDELIKVSKTFTKNGNYGLVLNISEPFFFIPFLGGFGGKVFDGKENISLNTPAMKKLAQLMYDLKYTHKIIPKEANYDIAQGLFNDGKAAFTINGPWAYAEYAENGIDFGVARIPKTSDGIYPAPYYGSKVLMINPNIKNQDTRIAVKKFIEFVNSAPMQLKLAKVTAEFPTNLEALRDPSLRSDERMNALASQMEVGVPMPVRLEMRAVWDAMRPVFVEVMSGKTKPANAPARMQNMALKLKAEQLDY
ncbi:MAG: maltose ABC transporter substrate-binding protein [Clostridia bacterium]|nr:maltose ABC transporter substrate-binding protein [Clostridia bacterium]